MERKFLVKSAKYWFDIARNPKTKTSDKVFAMEQAYNHVENALVWLLEKSSLEIKEQFLKING